MDPYIEACGLWEGFHGHLIHRICEALAVILPRGYFIDVATRKYVVLDVGEGGQESLPRPDVTVSTLTPRATTSKKGGAVAGAAPIGPDGPVPMQAFVADEFKENFVEIYALGKESILVTCIEVLSPSNKRRSTEGWSQYERKRQALLLGRANFIELDLLRGGDKMPMLTPWPDTPYTLLVGRATRAPHCRVWPGHFQRPLPPIPVPLLSPDPDLTLNLQPLIEDIYTLGRYDERLDYTRPLDPPLSKAEAAWVRDALKDRPARPPRKGRKP
jgi:hypothetical protein